MEAENQADEGAQDETNFDDFDIHEYHDMSPEKVAESMKDYQYRTQNPACPYSNRMSMDDWVAVVYEVSSPGRLNRVYTQDGDGYIEVPDDEAGLEFLLPLLMDGWEVVGRTVERGHPDKDGEDMEYLVARMPAEDTR